MAIDITGKVKAFAKFVEVCEKTVQIEDAYDRAKSLKSDARDLFDICSGLLFGEEQPGESDNEENEEIEETE